MTKGSPRFSVLQESATLADMDINQHMIRVAGILRGGAEAASALQEDAAHTLRAIADEIDPNQYALQADVPTVAAAVRLALNELAIIPDAERPTSIDGLQSRLGALI